MQSEIGTPAVSSPSTTLMVPAPTSGNKSFDLGGQFGTQIERKKVAELFAKATRRANGCLICHRKSNPKGYCYVTLGRGRRERAHRLVHTTTKGPIPPDKIVMHSCDTRNCIEPEHLELGSNLDNSKDMVAKGRQSRLGKPATSGNTLLETAELYLAGWTYKQIAKHQGLAGVSSVKDRLRRARLEQII